jgi:PAS domain S-box-containing protein
MKLSTRMAIAMVALVLLTAVAVGSLSYRNLTTALLPSAAERSQIHVRLLATRLQSYVQGARDDIFGFRSAVALRGIVRAQLAGGVDPVDGTTEEVWRQRMASRYTEELAAKTAYDQFRIIAANGRELLRVDRSGKDGAIRIVPDAELQDKADRGYFKAALNTAPDVVYVSRVELNREHGAIEVPHVPVLRVAAVVEASDRKPFGIVIINVDMRPILHQLALSAQAGGLIYVVDDRGDYLLHPDPAREFGSDTGNPTGWRSDFPKFAAAFDADEAAARRITDGAGARAVAALAPAVLAGGPRVAVMEVTPEAVLLAPAAAVGRSTLIAGIASVLCAAGLAVLLARSLTRPLEQMTAAVEAFPEDRSAAAPTEAAGELGVLARAFERMTREVMEKTGSLEKEVEEHRRTEAELERHTDQERLFSAAVRSSQDAIVTLSPDGLVTGWNPAATRLLDWRPEDILGRSIDIIVPDDRRGEARDILEKIRRGETVDHHETVRQGKDRRLVEVSLSVSPIRAPSGAIIGACKIARDITESKKTKALFEKESAERRRIAEILDNTVTTMSDAILIADEAGKILLSNPAARRLLGVTAGMTTESWTHGYDIFLADGMTRLPWQDGPLMRTVRGEMVANLDIVIRHRDNGRTISLVANGGPIQSGSPKERGGIVVYRDVTAAKESERQLRHAQKMEAMGQLTGGVAHDFNNILTVITGTIEIIAEGVAGRPDLVEIAGMIDDAAKRGTELTCQLLAFSRQQPLAPRSTDVNALIVEAGRLLHTTLGEHVEIESMLDDGIATAMVDPTQLTTAVLNLALNARDAMPDGGKLTLETADVVLDESYARMNPGVTPGPYVLIAVSDTGTGISRDIVDKVFDPFFTTKDVGKGTGLGLSMVYGFIKQSGGHIKIYSEPNQGTSVKMYLPHAMGEPSRILDGAPAEAIRGGDETVLVVEDDALVRRHAVAQVMALGYTTLAATNAAEAMALIDSRSDIDLLFTDIVMPGAMNGRQLADEAVGRRPELQVLYTSGYTEDAIVHHGRLDPGVLLLPKPYRRADLAHMIRRALDFAADRVKPAPADKQMP